ncbi:hypothetical protein P7C71_g6167, partial [Lecanoromycetidae sp. Uapishka_2]
MAQQYASKQPEGFKNHVENVAIVGAGGQVGKYLVEELLKTGSHHITAITRAESSYKAPSGVKVTKVDYSDSEALVKALQGIEVLIITMAVTAPPEQQTALIDAAAAAHVPWVFPNEWGVDSSNDQLGKDTLIGERSKGYRKHIEELGKSSWIGITCSFWYEYSLSMGPETYGFDIKNRSVIFFDDGETRINTSTWPQCGRAIASLLSLKVLPDNEHDKSTFLSQFRGRHVYISSFLVNQKEMLDSVMRVTGTKLDDWKITHESPQERYKSGMAELQKGNRMGFARVLYSRVFYKDGGGDYESKHGLQNEVLGLPKEDMDEATKAAIKRVEEGAGLHQVGERS